VTVLGDLSHKSSGSGVVDPRDIVHAADDEVRGIGGPGQIVDFGAQRPAHVLRTPCLLVLQAVGPKGRVVVVAF